MYAKIATKIPAAVATSASEIAGAITEKPTLECDENLANDSKIPTTVPNRPINGEVDETIDNQEIPLLASLIIEISHACNIGFDLILLLHLLRLDSGLNSEFRDVKLSSDFFSVRIDLLIAIFL